MKSVTVVLDKMPEQTFFCEIDYPGPGSVYGLKPRLSFFDRDGKRIYCRSPSDAELVALQASINTKYPTPRLRVG